MKNRYEKVPPPHRRRLRNVLTFLYSGMYNVTYPKSDSRSRTDSTGSLDNAHTHGNNNSSSSSGNSSGNNKLPSSSLSPVHAVVDEKAQYAQAMKMLKGIDNVISGAPEEDIESVADTVTLTGEYSIAC